MTTTRVRLCIGIAASGAALALLLSGCTAEPASDLSPSASASTLLPESDSAAPSASGAVEPSTGAASEACTAYFQLDLLNSTYAGGAVADGDMTETQVRNDFQRLLKTMVVQGKVAVADGTADQKLVTNAVRMRKAVNGLAKGRALSDLTNKQQMKFATQSSRVQKSCSRAGYPLPEDNIVARSAAGI